MLCLRVINLPEINFLAGYEVGDRILKAVASLLATRFPDGVAVLSPGAFAVLLNPVTGHEEAQTNARALLADVQVPQNIDLMSIEPRCVGGLAIFPDHARDAGLLLRNADMAQMRGLELRRDVIVYSDDFEPDSRHLQLMGDFTKAIDRGDFVLLCQPKLDLRRHEIVGGEILVRWHHPDFGILSPGEFIPLAEKTGFIKTITFHIIERIVRYMRNNAGDAIQMQFSVNVAAKDMSDPHFAKRVQAICGEYASRFLLEITETDAMEDRRQVLQTARDLHRAGICLSVDDFGTGYSSLSYLRELDPEELKIDRSFVRSMLHSPGDLKLVKSTIQLAHELGISVVAEGVEDADTLKLLETVCCDKAQGYFISRPMPLEAFAGWLAGRRAMAGGGRAAPDPR